MTASRAVGYYDSRWNAAARRENPLEKARREQILAALEAVGRRDLRMLDLGCGRGLLAPQLLPHGHLTGVDWSAEGIRCCHQLCPEGNFLVGSFFELDLPAEHFDVVISQEVVEHLSTPDQLRYLRLAERCLRPGGRLILTTPNRPVMARFNREYLQQRGKPWTDQPIENWLARSDLARLIRQCHLRVLELRTFAFGYGHSGLLRLINSTKASTWLPAWSRVAQWLGAGLHIFLVARKRLAEQFRAGEIGASR